jgi:glycine cleavage system H protein
MSEASSPVVEGLSYARSHEWVRVEGDRVIIGITHHAQDQLGDVVFVELPEVGAQVRRGATFGVVESVKAVSDLYSPVSGEVVARNEALVSDPSLANTDCYGEGWCLVVQPTDLASDLAQLLSAADYRALTSDGQG